MEDMLATPSLAARPNAAKSSPLVAMVVPAGAFAAELRGTADAASLYPEELADCTSFGPRRLADFAAGRLCARLALAQLGFEDFPLHRNADRRPGWPAPVVGSISHTAGFCAAVAGERARFPSIGLDVEVTGRVTHDLWPLIFTPAETARLRALPDEQRSVAATIAFSAKEAYYKCQFGITGNWLDFSDVEIAVEETLLPQGSLRVVPCDAARMTLRGTSLHARYAREDRIVVTGITLVTET